MGAAKPGFTDIKIAVNEIRKIGNLFTLFM
jgi:hypothetical protein